MIGLLAAESKDSQRGRFTFKPFASLAFVAAALAAGMHSAGAHWIVAALLLSLAGDILLIPKSVKTFQAGVGAFMLAHVAFIAAFVVRGIDWTSLGVALVPLSILGFLIARELVPRVEAALRGAVIGYSVILTVMLSAAVGTYAKQHSAILLIAAVLFYLSDLTVARDKFVREAFANRLVGLPLYYAAQFLFAATLV